MLMHPCQSVNVDLFRITYVQEYIRFSLGDFHSESYSRNEQYSGNNREYNDDDDYEDDDDDDENLSYIETGRSSAMLSNAETLQLSTLPADGVNFNSDISDDSDEEKDYIALRNLVFYGMKSDHFDVMFCLLPCMNLLNIMVYIYWPLYISKLLL